MGKGKRNRENRHLAEQATVRHPASMTKTVARKVRKLMTQERRGK